MVRAKAVEVGSSNAAVSFSNQVWGHVLSHWIRPSILFRAWARSVQT